MTVIHIVGLSKGSVILNNVFTDGEESIFAAL